MKYAYYVKNGTLTFAKSERPTPRRGASGVLMDSVDRGRGKRGKRGWG
jgi:hypothetical protein